jgi:hypothetical protein
VSRPNFPTTISGECWRFTGAHDNRGYGVMKYLGKTERVHRVSAFMYLGLHLDSELMVLHKPECKFRDCWRPEHLYAGTAKDNAKDTLQAGHFMGRRVRGQGQTHCKRGHEYTPENTYRNYKGRSCKICQKALKGKK